MAKIAEFLMRLDKLRERGPNKWMACCPAHSDRSPSLSVLYDSGADKVIIKCFGGCGALEVVEAVGMTLADMMPERVEAFGAYKRPKLNKLELFDKLLHESSILRIVCEDMLHGQMPEGDDLARALDAIRIISNIRDEVARHGR